MARLFFLSLCLVCSVASAQGTISLSITKDTRVLPAIERFNGIALHIDTTSIDDFPLNANIEVRNFPLSHSQTVGLTLQRFEVFTKDAIVVNASIDNGNIVERVVTQPHVVLLKGTIKNEPASKVFLAIGKYTTNGWIESNGSTYVIAKHPEGKWTTVYELDAIDPTIMNWVDLRCATETVPQLSQIPKDTPTQPRSVGVPCPALRMAIDTDWQFTGNLFGGNTEASGEYAATLIGAVSTIFETDIGISTNICYLRLWENSGDPWSGGGSSAQLTEFTTHWNVYMNHIDRHVAHMLSGQGLGGGIAYVRAVCTSSAYAVSGNINGSFPIPIEDHNGNNWDLMVVAHETGHNCGTWHTHDYDPPIDGCGLGDCSNAWGGTIMSYCHTCSGGLSNMVMSFHPLVLETISNYLANDISCSLGGDGSTPVAPLDMVWKLPFDSIDIDVLANDYANDCSLPSMTSYDTTSYFGGTIEMIGDDPTTAILRFNPPTQEYHVDVFKYYIADTSGQEAEGHVTIYTDIPRVPDTPSVTELGTQTNYYMLDQLSSLPDFGTLDPIGEEIVSQINFASTGGNFAGSGLSDDVGAVFTGFIDVPTSETYTLYVESDDGSKLYIGNELIVDNDGLHGMQEESGEIALGEGLHAITVEFFERGGGAGCIVRIAGGGLSKQVIPSDMWHHEVEVYGDVNSDGIIDVHDLLIVIAEWGDCHAACPADLNADTVVNINDLLILIAEWS